MRSFLALSSPPDEPHFRGYRAAGGGVFVTGPGGGPVSERWDLWNHSPDGFEWGYGGSGPAQLALAILAHIAGDDEQAVRLHQAYKFDVVASLPKEGWYLTVASVREWIAAKVVAGHLLEGGVQ